MYLAPRQWLPRNLTTVLSRHSAIVFWVVAASIAGIATSNDTVDYLSLSSLREENHDNVAKIQPGMTRADVIRIMGNKEADTRHGNPVRNPFRTNIVSGQDGVSYEVLLYYTERHAKFGKVRDSNCTPVILSAGKVVGVGKPRLRALRGW